MPKQNTHPNLNAFTLERIWTDDNDLIKQYYLWQNEDEEKDKYCFTPVVNGKTESTDEGLQSFRDVFIKHLKQGYYFILKKKETGEYLGYIYLINYNFRNYNAEVGFFFPKANRNKGYGTIILSLLLQTAFQEDFFWRLNKISAETSSYNTPSIKLLEKHGFQREGTGREHYWFGEEKYDQWLFSLLRSEYQTQS